MMWIGPAMDGEAEDAVVPVSELPLTDELAVMFARASNMLLTEETVSNALLLITEAAVLAVEDAVGAGVSLMEADGRRSSAASTASVVAAADALQYDLGEGPCLTAWASGKPVDSEDIRTDPRWMRWGQAAADLGVRSCVSVPLLSGDLAFGAIKVYWEAPGTASPRLIHLLEAFASQASIFLVNALAKERVSALSDQLKSSLAQREQVATAKGITMATLGLGEHEAVLHLIARSNKEKRRLHEVAREVIDNLPGSTD
ncbi:GAF and ANTAR domain-containing protein [Paenarthrobacter nicotinovorans]|uniref:GAF and ANTAR domain-containing protein n=1 Tax=Paenarthrobacter nicotinovorans TaxID=29320 RepID=UPI002781D1C3|nr:GAF and ANTAR domain-containing protein [Paenarthrobacter nicotinovorans]MDP9933966.1 GAF domain-containing protein [Paenarthrobacter nicotinovorans]